VPPATSWPAGATGVIGLERFELGHARGASHDTSRILRHSYHTPSYVRLTQEAYADWARLERDSGEDLVTVVGGLDLFPPGCRDQPVDYTTSLEAVGIDHEVLDPSDVADRWPQFRLPEGTLVLHQPDAAIVPAAGAPGSCRSRPVAAARTSGSRRP
jgi:sarcosine oxidase